MAKNNGYTTIYSDDDIVVLNKQSGILIAADRYNQEAPRLDFMAEKEFGKLFAVHRIDKDTSGIIVYARTTEAHKKLSEQFEKRLVHKTYHALVYGHPLWPELHVDLALQPDGDIRHRTVVSKKYGKPSVTDFTNLGSCGPYSWIIAKPKTGRTHQLRAHMQYIGHPIIGDDKYFIENKFKISSIANKLYLHAYKIDLSDIYKNLVIRAPLPNYFVEALKVLGLDWKAE